MERSGIHQTLRARIERMVDSGAKGACIPASHRVTAAGL